MKIKFAAVCVVLAALALAGGCATVETSVPSPEPSAAPERTTGSNIPRRRLIEPPREAGAGLPG